MPGRKPVTVIEEGQRADGRRTRDPFEQPATGEAVDPDRHNSIRSRVSRILGGYSAVSAYAEFARHFTTSANNLGADGCGASGHWSGRWEDVRTRKRRSFRGSAPDVDI